METSLHRQLKQMYAPGDARLEVPLGAYRIDVVCEDELIEIQHGSLFAIRDKIQTLLRKHRVRVVKPIIACKTLVQQKSKGGAVLRRRKSPKKGRLLNLFDELIYFTGVFPHVRLTLEVLLVEIEELRYPGHGRRRWRHENDFQIEDQTLVGVREVHQLHTSADLRAFLPRRLPQPFHTGHLAKALDVDRQIAQRMVYCLRHAGTLRQNGKQGRALLYEFADQADAA